MPRNNDPYRSSTSDGTISEIRTSDDRTTALAANWLTRLRSVNEEGRGQWSDAVSQRQHLRRVLAPFHWTRLAETLGHQVYVLQVLLSNVSSSIKSIFGVSPFSSVFREPCQQTPFSYIDPFESDCRQRRRRRPVTLWVDDRFVRPGVKPHLGTFFFNFPSISL